MNDKHPQPTRRDFLVRDPAVAATALGLLSSAGASAAVESRVKSPVGAGSSDVHKIEGRYLAVTVDVPQCRWWVELKNSDVKVSRIYFLGGDNPSGWNVTASINPNDENAVGHFTTITLHGTKKEQLDFDYHISVSKTGTDIVVRLDRANHTGAPAEIGDMDYMLTDDARLGGTIDKWLSFGAKSAYSHYYDLNHVYDFPMLSRGDYVKPETMYEVCHLIRNTDTGRVILMGHLTVQKGHSRFTVSRKDSADSMGMRAFCAYDITMPNGAAFSGEKLLLHFGDDGIRSLEHFGDLIALANDIRLKEKRPLDFDDKAVLAFTQTRWIRWASGGTNADAAQFIVEHGLDKFYYGGVQKDPEYGANGGWGVYHDGGGFRREVPYPAECYLPVKILYGNGKVADFSNPLTVEMEKQRIARIFEGKEHKVNGGGFDYADSWDKWPGQHDPFKSGVETWRACASLWRDFVDSRSPRMRNHSDMSKVDFSYGFIDVARISEDSDGMYVKDAYAGGCDRRGPGHRAFLGECAVGNAMRFFYNTRVYWNDGDHTHVYKYQGGRTMPYGEAKVTVCYKAIATSCMRLSEAFKGLYPEDRIELLKRASPPTADAAYPVDLFVRKPAAVWNLPVEREFGKWNVLAVFNFGPKSPDFAVTLDAEKDLRLDAKKEYIVYEFWSRKLIGTFKGTFSSRAVFNKDCDVYSIVAKREYPVLISTSRHVRQMAFDIKRLAWNPATSTLSGLSRAVSGDPYQLRIYIPAQFALNRADTLSDLTLSVHTDGPLLTVDYTTSSDNDVAWSLHFRKSGAS